MEAEALVHGQPVHRTTADSGSRDEAEVQRETQTSGALTYFPSCLMSRVSLPMVEVREEGETCLPKGHC